MTLAHIIFLFHFRSILIVTFPLPVSILISFILMKQFGITSNIMSPRRHRHRHRRAGGCGDRDDGERHPPLRRGGSDEGRAPQCHRNVDVGDLDASKQVGRPIFFAMAIIILAFVPVFALTGRRANCFIPLAFTKTFAMIGSTLLAVTIVPVLCAWLVRGPFHSEDRNMVMRVLLRIYDPVLDWALRCRRRSCAVGCCWARVVVAFGCRARSRLSFRRCNGSRGMGSEFMPPLNEGSLLFMPVLLPATSLTEVKRIMAWQDHVIKETPKSPPSPASSAARKPPPIPRRSR